MNTKSNFWKSITLVGVLIPVVFWLRFGRVDGFAIAFTAFLILIITAVQFLPGLAEKARNESPARNISSSWFDRLGVVWLLSIPFAPFLAWMIGEFLTITAGNWRIILGIKTGLCVVVPCVCVLPLTRYLSGKNAVVASLILAIGTSFPVIIGWNSMRDLIKGPTEKNVTVTDVQRIYYTRNFKRTPTDILEVTLEDGNLFQANSRFVSIERGSQTLTILENVDVVISAK